MGYLETGYYVLDFLDNYNKRFVFSRNNYEKHLEYREELSNMPDRIIRCINEADFVYPSG